MDSVLVTGATGFTGSHLTRDLVADGHAVRVLARSASRARETLPAEVEIVEGDVTDRDIVGRAVRGRDVVYHLAAAFREAGIPDRRYREVHVDATRHLLDAARSEGTECFVHCSTVGVHGHIEHPPADEDAHFAPGDIYQETKAEGERLALDYHRRHGLPVAVIRPAAIYGPGDLRFLKLFRAVARRRFVMIGSGRTLLHMVHVTDLVRGLRLAAERPAAVGEAVIIAGEDYHSLDEIAATIAAVAGVAPPRWRVPVWPFEIAGAVVERLCVPLRIDPPIHRRRVAFFTKSRAFSIDKARRVLGYEPIIGLEHGFSETVAWYRDRGYL